MFNFVRSKKSQGSHGDMGLSFIYFGDSYKLKYTQDVDMIDWWWLNEVHM